MIECIICFIVGGLSGALVMSLCAVSKNSNEILEDGSANITENGDVNITQERAQNNNIKQPHFLPCKRCAVHCPDSIKEVKAKKGILSFALCDDYSEQGEER